MKLTGDQITAIKSWIESGDDLSKIQNQINESFDINLTYLETRFLLSDLKIELNEEEEEEPVDETPDEIQDSDNVTENTEDPEQQETPSGDPEKEETEEGAQPTNINVSVDSITQPQCVISGKVTFSDGQLASWWFDQMGQLGLNPDKEGYTPSREDVAVFQVELRKVLAEQGLG